MAESAPAWARARAIRAESENETRRLLLDAAAQIFADVGYAAATVALITARAEVSRGAFYAYFAAKAEIFAALAERVRDEFLAAHEILGVDENDPYELGRASSAAFLAAYAANERLLPVIESQARVDNRIAAIWEEIDERPTRRVARYVRRMAAAGAADPPAAPAVVAEVVVAMFRRFGSKVPDEEGAFEELVEDLTAVYLRVVGVARDGVSGERRPLMNLPLRGCQPSPIDLGND